jgi:hypothetical protein
MSACLCEVVDGILTRQQGKVTRTSLGLHTIQIKTAEKKLQDKEKESALHVEEGLFDD